VIGQHQADRRGARALGLLQGWVLEQTSTVQP
jgi:hypothetical protein